ncbi:hypothetical protein CVT24_000378 [Panaeolus cyanescens]|uniref:alkaline phosphatase n=1 Tax=Panaeolus cyanescens TaxID=181874 RepID=A0A409YD09_9AGAR|nr:hypothetical protein CVT24_000378 [Panaeolus cyanescens]
MPIKGTSTKLLAVLAALNVLPAFVSAQTFQRLGACPTLGCIFPPDQTDFLEGQLFDIRLEVHAPVNGSEATNNGVPDEKFTFCIQSGKGKCEDVTKFFKIKDSELEKWDFSYYEDLFAKDAKTPTAVNVASKAYRAVSPKVPYDCQTIARWNVRKSGRRKAKNVLFFIGDGMTQPMITAARLIAHKSINGRYQSLMQMDQMDNLGHQMTHSIDSFITDSANSATALYTGKKSSVNALNVYADSSKDSFDDPKIETIAELFRRKIGGALGIVSTAYIADATPAALCAHTRDRGQSASVVVEYLNSAAAIKPNLSWPTSCKQPDVIFGGGAEQFFAGKGSPNGTDYYKAFQDKGYNVVLNNTALQNTSNKKKTLGIFSRVDPMTNAYGVLTKLRRAKWIDRNVLPENLKNQKNSPTGDGTDALDQPGLKDMTLKAIDILQERTNKNEGWFMMAEAASIDKMMHALDYDRALGELLELDDTIRASIAHLKKIGEYEDTLIVITADHGHGFDVFGGADTKYLAAQTGDRKKRAAVGVYANSGLSGYTVAPDQSPTNQTVVFGAEGPNFPVQWNPRYAFAAGFGANPDRRETFGLNTNGPRVPAVSSSDGVTVNPADNPDGFTVTGTLPVEESQGVHSLQDVSVFANGPGSEAFRGVYNSPEIFFKIADALGLPPPLGSRSPPQNENDGALARFARLKQQSKPPSQPKVLTSPPRPEKWSVKDTSVNIATAFTQAASGDMNTSSFSNPNNAWASGSRQNLQVPRSTSVEYEASASNVTRDRRLAPPPPRLANSSMSRKPPSKQASFRSVPDSEGEEEQSLTLNGRAKSPFETSINYARQALESAVYYVRQRSQEPSGEQNPNANTTNESSYDYAAEEQAFQSAKKSTARRGRISTDNKAYKPSQSEDEYSSEYSDDGKKRKKKTKKIKGLKLPIMAGEKKRKKKPKGTAGGADEDEESESDDNTQEIQSQQLRASLPPNHRASVSRTSLEPPSISIDHIDDSTSFAEQGLQSIPEVEEEHITEVQQQQRAPSRPRERPRSRSRSRPPLPAPSNVSIGGFLGSIVNLGVISGQALGNGFLSVWNFLMYLIGLIAGNFIDLIIRRPASWVNASAGLQLLVKYLLPGAVLLAALYIIPETTSSAVSSIRSYLPSISFGHSKAPPYIPSDIPPSNLDELIDRLSRVEKLIQVLQIDTQTSVQKTEDGLTKSYNELLTQLGKLQSKLEVETRKALRQEADAREGVARAVNGVKQEMEVLHSQIKVQEKERERERKERERNPPAGHTVVEVDEEAKAKLKVLEEKLGNVEGGVKEAIELSKKAVSTAQTQQQQSSKDAKDAAWWNKLASGTKSGLQIKSSDGQDVTSLISHLVTDAVSHSLSATDNGVGRPDLAASAGGARVIPHLTSQTLSVQPASLTQRLSSFFAGRSPTAFGRPPVTALHHETQNGHCWPFEGSQGQLGVALAAPAFVDSITIDHVSKQLAYNMGSAPRVMEVWGMIEGQDNEERVQAWREKRKAEAESRGQDAPQEPEYPATLGRYPEFLRLANFTYDINAGNSVQTFPVEEEVKNLGVDFGVVVLRVLSNWGRDQFTCLYRFRVHGEILMAGEEQQLKAHADDSS